MRFTFRTNNKDDKVIQKYLELLIAKGHQLDEFNPEFVFVFGGDGTVIKAVHDFKNQLDKVNFIGINFGNLGFYTDFTKYDLDELLMMLENDKFAICHLPLIEYKITNRNQTICGTALNEVTIINPEKTIVMDVYINNEHFESFRGTGMAISSPSGSTAYNKSLGGAIVDINIKAMQMTEIASINNRIYKTIGSPILLDNSSIIKMKPHNFNGCIFTYDNMRVQLEDIEDLSVYLSKRSVNLLTKPNRSFFHRVKTAFIANDYD